MARAFLLLRYPIATIISSFSGGVKSTYITCECCITGFLVGGRLLRNLLNRFAYRAPFLFIL